ncbi:MAG TPA: carbon storage regulator [Lacipirellula sp.]
MLVLTRKQGEQIRIGAEILITVVRTKGKAVRLGIQAPAHVPVLRGEIAVAIADDEEQKAASSDEHDEDPWPRAAGSGRGVLRSLVASRGDA